mmetsp:Transcript_70393/g.205887  ORF Transcript_70393/g.205887 Transcript_70393/m.205887 type:complete len:248 (+) Transcript_70393:1094-1837(+)
MAPIAKPATPACAAPARRMRSSTARLERSAPTMASRSPSTPLTATTHILGMSARSQRPAPAWRRLCAATAPPGSTSVTRSSCTEAPVGLRKFRPSAWPAAFSSDMLKCAEWRPSCILIAEGNDARLRCICLTPVWPFTLRIRSPICIAASGFFAFHSTIDPTVEISDTTKASGPASRPSLAPKASLPVRVPKPSAPPRAFNFLAALTARTTSHMAVPAALSAAVHGAELEWIGGEGTASTFAKVLAC